MSLNKKKAVKKNIETNLEVKLDVQDTKEDNSENLKSKPASENDSKKIIDDKINTEKINTEKINTDDEKVNDKDSFNYYENTFNVIDSILYQRNTNELVNHQLSSYKKFIDKNLDDIIQQFNIRKIY